VVVGAGGGIILPPDNPGEISVANP